MPARARSLPASPAPSDQDGTDLLLREARKIVEGIGKMFAPFCEVVLHDLTQPDTAVAMIECPLSGRSLGSPTTQMGRARLEDPSFPDIVQNYAHAFPDGRPAKSTSIGLKNKAGKCVASICLNLDTSQFSLLQQTLDRFTAVELKPPVQETMREVSNDDVRQIIKSFASQYNLQPQALPPTQRREIVRSLANAGHLQVRNSVSVVAKTLGVSRSSVYQMLKIV